MARSQALWTVDCPHCGKTYDAKNDKTSTLPFKKHLVKKHWQSVKDMFDEAGQKFIEAEYHNKPIGFSFEGIPGVTIEANENGHLLGCICELCLELP